MTIVQTIAERVTQLIEASGLTLEEFARRARREPERLRDALAGPRRFTSLDLALIADSAGATVSWLLDDEPKLTIRICSMPPQA